MPRYALARHVFACLDGEHVVLLDLKQNRYLAVKAATTSGLASLVHGWPEAAAAPESAAASNHGGTEAIIRTLIGRGLLSESSSNGEKPAQAVQCPASADLLTDDSSVRRAVPFRSIAALFAASISAGLQLRCRPLERVILGVQGRKAAAATESQPFDFDAAHTLVEDFNLLRPFLFTARDACLFSSLALLGFLARHGLYPNWVFGVQTRPFAAHCWIQRDAVVFNDTVDHVSRYTPIMVI